MLLQAPHYYDIGLLGLMWLGDDRDHERPYARSFSPIIWTLRELKIINKRQHRDALNDARLRMKIRSKLSVCSGAPGKTTAEQLEEEIKDGKSYLALRLPWSDAFFQAGRVLGQDSYRYFLTQSGRNYARTKEEPYANIITRVAFLEGHAVMRLRVKDQMQRTRGRRSAVPLEEQFSAADLD